MTWGKIESEGWCEDERTNTFAKSSSLAVFEFAIDFVSDATLLDCPECAENSERLHRLHWKAQGSFFIHNVFIHRAMTPFDI